MHRWSVQCIASNKGELLVCVRAVIGKSQVNNWYFYRREVRRESLDISGLSCASKDCDSPASNKHVGMGVEVGSVALRWIMIRTNKTGNNGRSNMGIRLGRGLRL